MHPGIRAVALEAGDGGNVDDLARPSGDHEAAGHFLGQQEAGVHVQVHHLLPAGIAVLGRRLAPGGAGIVDQDVDGAETGFGGIHQGSDGVAFGLAQVAGDAVGFDATGLELGHYLLHFVSLARVHEDACALLPQCLGHLQTNPLVPPVIRATLPVRSNNCITLMVCPLVYWSGCWSDPTSPAPRGGPSVSVVICQPAPVLSCGLSPRWILPWQNMTSGAQR